MKLFNLQATVYESIPNGESIDYESIFVFADDEEHARMLAALTEPHFNTKWLTIGSITEFPIDYGVIKI